MDPRTRYTVRYDHAARCDTLACHQCGSVTHHPEDVRQHYCPRCHQFLDDPPPPVILNKNTGDTTGG